MTKENQELLNAINKRFDRIEERLDAHDKRFDGIERSIATLMEEQTKMRILLETEIRDEIRVISERNAETLTQVVQLSTQYMRLVHRKINNLQFGLPAICPAASEKLADASASPAFSFLANQTAFGAKLSSIYFTVH